MRIKLLIVSAIMLAGCSRDEPIEMKWSYGDAPGWYPITAMGEPVYYMGEQAFINRTSLLVNCEGKGIRQRDLLGFLTNANEVILYESVHKRMTERHPSWLILERGSGRVIQEKEGVQIDFALRGSGEDMNNQCTNLQNQPRQIRLQIQ